MLVKLTHEMKAKLKRHGVECFHNPGIVNISTEAIFEPPCSIKWMSIENEVYIGAFSYAVSGYFSNVSIGRYSSIGESVQIGRSNHAMDWVSTSPFFYVKNKLFDVGEYFSEAESYHTYSPNTPTSVQSTAVKKISIGNDVWIGHGAFIRPGVTIGDGAIVGAYSVVTKNVPPFGVVAGNPATLKKMRLPPQLIAAFLELQWWKFAPWQLSQVEFFNPEHAAIQLKKLSNIISPYKADNIRIADFLEATGR